MQELNLINFSNAHEKLARKLITLYKRPSTALIMETAPRAMSDAFIFPFIHLFPHLTRWLTCRATKAGSENQTSIIPGLLDLFVKP